MREIDWKALAEDLGVLAPTEEDGVVAETSSTRRAQIALAEILGERELLRAAKYFLAGKPGSELARSVLALLRPPSIMSECYRLYRESASVEERRSAVYLLRWVADAAALPWISEFLSDPDHGIQIWGIVVLERLAVEGFVGPEDVQDVLSEAERHPNLNVRETAAIIRGVLGR